MLIFADRKLKQNINNIFYIVLSYYACMMTIKNIKINYYIKFVNDVHFIDTYYTIYVQNVHILIEVATI